MFRSTVLGLLLLIPADAMAAAIVLVHGAYVGSWYWDPVADELRDMGHTVVAVDLNADVQAGRKAPKDISLDDHAATIIDAINAQGSSVVLISHSYGGRPSTAAWDIARDKISAVIFLEAVVAYGTGKLALPEEVGQRQALSSHDPEALAAGVLKPPAHLVQRYAGRELVPHSLRAAFAPVPLTRGDLPDTPGAYVLGSKSTAAVFRQYAQKVFEQRNWTIWEIDSGHDMVFEASEVLAQLLDKLSTELTAGEPR